MVLGQIVRRLYVYSIDLSGEGSERHCLLEYRKGMVTLVAGVKTGAAAPFVVLYRGKGVLQKVMDRTDERLFRIRESGEFIWEQQEEDEQVRITFLRKERMGEWESIRQGEKPGGVYLCMADEEPEMLRCALLFFRQRVTLSALAGRDALCSWVAGRLQRPVLFAVLGIVAGSYFASVYLEREGQLWQSQLIRRQQDRRTEDRISGEQAGLLSEFRQGGNYDYSLLLDRIAGCVPETVILHRLVLIPLLKPMEAGKKLQLREHYALIGGTTADVRDVNAFLTGLTGEKLFRQVKLLNLEQDKRSGEFIFQIELQI